MHNTKPPRFGGCQRLNPELLYFLKLYHKLNRLATKLTVFLYLLLNVPYKIYENTENRHSEYDKYNTYLDEFRLLQDLFSNFANRSFVRGDP